MLSRFQRFEMVCRIKINIRSVQSATDDRRGGRRWVQANQDLGSIEHHRGVALYGRAGRTVGAVALDSPRELVFFECLVAAGAPFPPELAVADWGGDTPPKPGPARFPLRGTDRPSAADAATRGALAARDGDREPACCLETNTDLQTKIQSLTKENDMPRGTLLTEIFDQSQRATPQKLWAEIRLEPVSRQDDGSWVITSYDAVRALTADPRVSAAAGLEEAKGANEQGGSRAANASARSRDRRPKPRQDQYLSSRIRAEGSRSSSIWSQGQVEVDW